VTCTVLEDMTERVGCVREADVVLRGTSGSGEFAVFTVREKGCSMDGDILAIVAIIGGRMGNRMTNAKHRYLSKLELGPPSDE
jgi:hypothetical protein